MIRWTLCAPSERVILAIMREIRRRIRLPLGLLLLLAVVPAAKAAPPVAVFIDGGYVIPGGNLDAAHIGENSGLGSDPGLELGLGLRIHSGLAQR